MFGSRLDGTGWHLELASHEGRIREVLFGATPELGDDEVCGGKETNAEPRLLHEDRRALTVAGRHGDDGPSGDILAQIGRNLALFEEGDELIEIAGEFSVEIRGLWSLGAVGVEGESPDQEEIQLGSGLLDVLLEQPDEVVKGEG